MENFWWFWSAKLNKTLFFESLLGEGSFGKVWLVTDGHYKLAAKISKNATFGVLDDQQLKEISILSQLTHRNIVQLVAVEDWPIRIVYTEFIQGGSLADYVKHHFPLSETNFKTILFQICSGLNYLHSYNPAVLHRDIKGENIMVAQDGTTVKLIDFGNATIFLFPEGTTASDWVITTNKGYCDRRFMAPELFQSPSQFTVMSDVWALGITLFEMEVGRPPFPNDQYLQASIQTMPAAQELGLLPGQLGNFFDCCTAKDPNARWLVSNLLNHPLLYCRCMNCELCLEQQQFN